MVVSNHWTGLTQTM